jgi:hypothetical protein
MNFSKLILAISQNDIHSTQLTNYNGTKNLFIQNAFLEFCN